MPNEELYLDQEEVLPEFNSPFEIDLSDDPKHPQWKSNPHHYNDVFYASRRKKMSRRQKIALGISRMAISFGNGEEVEENPFDQELRELAAQYGVPWQGLRSGGSQTDPQFDMGEHPAVPGSNVHVQVGGGTLGLNMWVPSEGALYHYYDGTDFQKLFKVAQKVFRSKDPIGEQPQLWTKR